MVLCVCLEMGGSLAWSCFLYSYVFIVLAVFRNSHLFSQIFDTVSVITNLYAFYSGDIRSKSANNII